MTCCFAIRWVMLSACIICSAANTLFAQSDSSENKISSVLNISAKAINGLQKQYSNLQSKLSRQSEKLLSRMQAKEDKLKRTAMSLASHKGKQRRHFGKIDSTKAQEVFTDDVTQHYQELQNKLSDTTKIFNRFPLKEYVPGLDSMQPV